MGDAGQRVAGVGGAAARHHARLPCAGTAPARRLPGAGRHRGPHHSATHRRQLHTGLSQGRQYYHRRHPGGRRPGDSPTGRDGRRVPARASGADRCGGAGAAHRLQQCGGAAARSRGDSPARAGPPRRPRRGPRPGDAPAPDRERGAGPGWRRRRTGRGDRGAPRGAGAGPRVCRAARRGGHRRRRARVYPWAVGPRRAGVRRRAGVPMVEELPGGHPQRGKPGSHRRLPAAALEPDAGGAGRGPGGARDSAAGRRGIAPAQLRGTHLDRSGLRPGQRDRSPHPQSRSRGAEPTLLHGAARGDAGGGAASRRDCGRLVVRPAAHG